MTTRSATIPLGDAILTVAYEVHGQHLPETMTDPEEWPEIELRQLSTPHGEDVSGLLEFEPVYERLLEKVTELEREERYFDKAIGRFDPDASGAQYKSCDK